MTNHSGFLRVLSDVRGRRRILWLGFGLLLIYCAWLAGPYFHSIVVRDAAVSSWLNFVTAPIDGQLVDRALWPGDTVKSDGYLASLLNPQADRAPLEQALGDFASAQARAQHLEKTVSEHRQLLESYVALFKEDLDLRITSQTASLEFLRLRVETERTDAARFLRLRDSGGESQAAAAAADARVAALEGERLAAEEKLRRNVQRRAAADRGIRLIEDGSETDWEIQVELRREEKELVSLRAGAATARAVAAAARERYEKQHQVVLTAPAGSLVWSRYASPGATVVAGSAIASWLNPEVLLVDVPVSDAEAALLRPGMAATAIFEGERQARPAKVLFIRGSAGTFATQELAAVAKGRRPGLGHAIIQTEVRPEDRLHCPVGHTAYVHFPDVSVFSVLRSRLRL